MNCIIIADKFNKGNKSKGWLGSHPINSKYTLVSNQISVINAIFPKAKIIYIYGFDDKKVEDYFEKSNHKNITLVQNPNYENYGETFSLCKARIFLESNTLIIPGLTILKKRMFTDFDRKKTSVFVNNKHHNELGCFLNDKEKIEHICYELTNYLTNIYYIHKNDIEIFRSIVSRNENRNCFVFEIINKMIERGVDVGCFDMNNKNILKTMNGGT